MPNCTICGKYLKTESVYCKRCLKYMKEGNAIYTPDKTQGEQLILGNGRRVCKICGKSYSNLSQHIVNCHKMTVKEYREMFNIPEDVKLAEFKPRAKHKVSKERKEKLLKTIAYARQKKKEHREDLKRRGIKRVEKHNITEEDRERRRQAMILINQLKKFKKKD